MIFTPTRAAGLARLTSFTPHMGQDYTARRNYDIHPNAASNLSPWIKHRLISEHEVLAQTLAHHDQRSALPFIQEVFWRGYFRGWLEQRPSVWTSYQTTLAQAPRTSRAYTDAIQGRTGIDCLDAWSAELIDTGYLHNHARMWFASIWIFTLRLPWELGADFFLTHLHDGDAASNTLSWRWVAGLHTKDKTYLATAENIARFTEGRFNPTGQLAKTAEPLSETTEHPMIPLSPDTAPPPENALLLVTSDDCTPTQFITGPHSGVVGLTPDKSFAQGAVTDALAQIAHPNTTLATPANLAETIIAIGATNVVTVHTPTGPTATHIAALKPILAQAGITLHQPRRHYDTTVWPHATHGFFRLKKKIPQILQTLGLDAARETP